jgi:hypothetical protein
MLARFPKSELRLEVLYMRDLPESLNAAVRDDHGEAIKYSP